MKVTKWQHALLQVELDGAQLIVDPGFYSALPATQNVVAITLSHVHDDHSFLEHVEELVRRHPEALLFGTVEVRDKLSNLKVQPVYHGDRYQVGPFTLDFYGDLHQEIHRSIPIVQNFGLMVNQELYYPGDSYTIPEVSVATLACPSIAPWLRISDVMDFVEAVRPQRTFPTHNALLSDVGHQLYNSRIQELTEKQGGEFRFLTPGQSWDI
jgi:L-ascorbate metabolism protein UlaG (beta-lactamase superfamily)